MSQIHILDLNSNDFLETLSDGEITSISGGKLSAAESIRIGLGALA